MIGPESTSVPEHGPKPADLVEKTLNLIDRLAVKTIGEDNIVRRGVYQLPQADTPLPLDWLVVRVVPSYGPRHEDYLEYYELLVTDEIDPASGEPLAMPALALTVDRGELYVNAFGQDLDNETEAARIQTLVGPFLDWVGRKEAAGLVKPSEETADAIDKLDPHLIQGYLSMLAADIVQRLGKDGKVALHVYGSGSHARLEILNSGRHLCLTTDWTNVDEDAAIAEHLLKRRQSHIFYEDDNLISIYDWLEKGRLVSETSDRVELTERSRLDETVDMGLVGDRLLHLVLMLENAKPGDVIPAVSA